MNTLTDCLLNTFTKKVIIQVRYTGQHELSRRVPQNTQLNDVVKCITSRALYMSSILTLLNRKVVKNFLTNVQSATISGIGTLASRGRGAQLHTETRLYPRQC